MSAHLLTTEQPDVSKGLSQRQNAQQQKQQQALLPSSPKLPAVRLSDATNLQLFDMERQLTAAAEIGDLVEVDHWRKLSSTWRSITEQTAKKYLESIVSRHTLTKALSVSAKHVSHMKA